ncbi:MAG: hypothetical protein ACRED1_04645, partial [Limisphaerales bacterium]
MKSQRSSFAAGRPFFGPPAEIKKHGIANLAVLAFALALVAASLPAKAQTITNTLLANPLFQANSGQTFPTSWTYFAPPGAMDRDYWIIDQASEGGGGLVAAQSGTNFWKQWNELYQSGQINVAGIYQTFAAAPGAIYQANGYITCSSADALPTTNEYSWIQVEFLDANSNLLVLYKSDVYNINVGEVSWFGFQVTNACDITQPVPTGDPSFTTYAVTGSVSQLVAPPGTALVRYRFCALWSGMEGGSVYFDTPALDQLSGPEPPAISGINPQNEIFVPPGPGLTFNAVSPSGVAINNSGIQLMLNGNDVSSGLVISGAASSKTATYYGLQSNTVYNAVISVTDSSGLKSTANATFQTTWVGVPAPSYVWEAEDFDFNGGSFIDNPDICVTAGDPDCYFGQVGEQGVDEFSTGTPPAQFYRGAADGIGTQPSGDYSRPDLSAAGRPDFCINPFNGNPSYSGAEWVNYTRDWPDSTNWIIARLATDVGLSGSIQLSLVTGDATNVLGSFTIPNGQGWTSFEFAYLMSTDGVNKANVVLNGKETLRATSGGNLLPTFFMLVPGEPDLPVLRNLYPTGAHPFEPTNALSFTVTTAGAIFPPKGIQVVLDGFNVSSNLVISGSASSNTVVYPFLATNEMHSVIITVTNSLGHGISLTNQFDTFTQSNYIFEAEDYDFNGGQFVPSAQYQPDCYTYYSSVTNVDYHHTINGGEPTDGSDYPYRQDGIPQQTTSDYYTALFAANPFSYVDYNLIWFGGGDWANYTRDYPNGPFNIYARTAGMGAYSMSLGRLISGFGTTNQVIQPLGQFSSTGLGQNTFAWVPLTDSGGVAPVTVDITGPTNTFQILTPTGDCYPNYFMLVPASPIRLSAARSGNNINISFTTPIGGVYRVFYRTNLTAGAWTLLDSLPGNGAVESATDSSAGDSQRFYKVTS